jgi:hypothetical protein
MMLCSVDVRSRRSGEDFYHQARNRTAGNSNGKISRHYSPLLNMIANSKGELKDKTGGNSFKIENDRQGFWNSTSILPSATIDFGRQPYQCVIDIAACSPVSPKGQ